MAVTTLLDIAKANGSDAAVGLIEEVMTRSIFAIFSRSSESERLIRNGVAKTSGIY